MKILKLIIACFILLYFEFYTLTGALAYAELGTMNPSSGAEYAYLMDAFGPMPAFLFSWISTLILKPSQVAIICLSFAKYAVEAFVDECGSSDYVVKIVAVLSICEFKPNVTYPRCLLISLFLQKYIRLFSTLVFRPRLHYYLPRAYF